MIGPIRQSMLRAPTPRSYGDVILEDSPLGYWRLNEAAMSSTFEDLGSASEDASANGSLTSGVASKNSRIVNCCQFDGSSAYLSVADSSQFRLVGDASFEAWIYIASGPAEGTGRSIFSCAGTFGSGSAHNRLFQIQIQRTGGNNGLGTFHQNGEQTGNTTAQVNWSWSINTWYHYVNVRDATAKTHTHYINGVQLGSPQSYSNNPDGGSAAVFAMGALHAGAVFQYWNGRLDELAIYNTTLPPARIREHYRAGKR